MKRRNLLTAITCGIASLFVSRTARASSPSAIDHTIPERDYNGKAICRVYRLAPDGTYREINRNTIRPGDRLILIGQDGDRLWKADAATVLEPDPTCCLAGGFVIDPGAPDLSLLVKPN